MWDGVDYAFKLYTSLAVGAGFFLGFITKWIIG